MAVAKRQARLPLGYAALCTASLNPRIKKRSFPSSPRCVLISRKPVPHFQTPDQLEGRIIIKTRSRISSTSLLSKECTLWESDDGDTVCPSILPLSIAFPAHYLDPHSGRDVRLPPSFSVSRPRRAAVVYSLTLTIRKRRSLLFCMRSPRCVDLHIRVHTPHIL